jgi:hypothetical protein
MLGAESPATALPMKCTLLALAAVAAFPSLALIRSDDEAQEAREEAFGELLSGARLIGVFTDDAHPDAAPQRDSYTLGRVEKADDDRWLFEALIEYGENSVKVPLYLTVEWAGDTPVITMDQVPVGPLGSFDARVLFHGDSYAGVWRGASHGGGLVGRIERAK